MKPFKTRQNSLIISRQYTETLVLSGLCLIHSNPILLLPRPSNLLAVTATMKKFGFKKKGEGDEESSRTALFGRSSKHSSPAPAANNPYAQPPPPANDPYAQDNQKYAFGPSGASPYQQARIGLPDGPGSGRGGLPSGPSPSRGGYGASPTPPAVDRASAASGGGYGAEKYGSGGGYGANRYGGPPAETQSIYGAGGYGGLARTNSNETTTTEVQKEALFGNAKERYANKPALPPSNGRPGGGYSADSTGTSDSQDGHGAYGEDRQLTAEEEEEEDVQAVCILNLFSNPNITIYGTSVLDLRYANCVTCYRLNNKFGS